MIVGHELQCWLDDRDRQRAAIAAARQFQSSWTKDFAYKRFAQAMEALPDRSAETVAEAVVSLFAGTCWIGATLDGFAAKLGDDPFFELPLPNLHSEIHDGILLFEDDAVSVAIGVTGAGKLAAKKNVERDAASIAFTGHVSVLKFIESGGAYLSFWKAPPIRGDFAAADASRCVRTGGRRLQDGEVLTVDGRFQSYVIEHAFRDMIVLQASIKSDQAPLSIEYDWKSHEYVGCSATDDGASRIQMMVTLLRKMECADAFPVLEELLGDPNFFVRWHVVREMLGLDAAAALPHLARMAKEDSHPDVRRAAQSVLDCLVIQHPGLRERVTCPA